MYSKIKFPSFVLFAYIISSILFAQSGPKVVMTPAKYDFGNIIQDSVVTLIFAITIEGDSKLKIIKVSASCGLTKI